MSTTLQNLLDAVHRRLNDFEQQASFSGTGDGSTTTYKLDDAPVISGTETIKVNAVTVVEDTSLPCTAGQYYLDDDTGWLVFGTAPTNAYAILASYRYRLYDDEMVTECINAAIDYLFPEFYIVGYDDDTVTDSTTYDYPLPPNTEKVIRVQHSSSNGSTQTWTNLQNWDVRQTNSYKVTAHTSDYAATTSITTLTLASGNGASVTINDVLKDAASNELVHVTGISTDTLTITRGYRSTTATTHASGATWTKWNDKVLHFSSPIGTGYLRLTVQKRSPGLVNTTDTLEYTAGLPERMTEPIVLKACADLLTTRIAPRVMDQVIQRADGQYVITPGQLTAAADRFELLAQRSANKLRQRPIPGRINLG